MDALRPPLPTVEETAAAVQAWADAEPLFNQLLEAGVPSLRALTRWSLELLRVGRIAEGVAVLRASLSLAPDDPALWTNLGVALGQGNWTGDAIRSLEYALALSNTQSDTWLMLGILRKKQGDLAGAETAYRAALRLERGRVAWELLAMVKEEQKDFAGALECLTECVKAGGKNAAVLANIGKLSEQTGRFAESAAAYEEARVMEPSNAHYRQMARKAVFLQETGAGLPVDEALANYQRSFGKGGEVGGQPIAELLHWAFVMLSGFGNTAAALRVGQKESEVSPPSVALDYLRQAVASDATITQSPAAFVAEHFDAFADRFDAQLVGVLGYDIPRELCAAVLAACPAGALLDTLDAGCGTGLCGALLRPISRKLTGVDLSPKMLEKARERKLYDALACEELGAFLRHSEASFDVIVAADTLIYFGELAPIFAAAAGALRPGGILAFSAERWNGDRYRLLPSGRFSHAPGYVREVAAKAFDEVSMAETTIRLEGASRLAGNVFVFRRRL